MVELTTVTDSEAVFFVPAQPERGMAADVRRYEGLAPDTEHELEGVTFRTLPRPAGELLCRVATVNDLHFGELEAGHLEGLPVGPVLRSEPGEDPYPEVMNRGAAEEIAALDPALVVVKGDLSDAGGRADLEAFARCYSGFAGRLVPIPGNHDVAGGDPGGPLSTALPARLDLPGVTVGLLDTTIPRWHTGRVPADQLEWLDELGAGADRPVLVMGHHHPWGPGSNSRPEGYFGINPDDSEALVGVFSRRPRLAAYLAGHTHRNRVRRFAATGTVPWVEVASVKEFPGCWAEYRVYEGGIRQVVHRISGAAALAWTERTRALFGGMFPAYAFGELGDRCMAVTGP
ncbi:MAG TPA: metallophosphoesterase [Acidimicrobiales bacterium]|nr:metallophosphoesterase [Acidimicrobiales bacterium]